MKRLQKYIGMVVFIWFVSSSLLSAADYTFHANTNTFPFFYKINVTYEGTSAIFSINDSTTSGDNFLGESIDTRSFDLATDGNTDTYTLSYVSNYQTANNYTITLALSPQNGHYHFVKDADLTDTNTDLILHYWENGMLKTNNLSEREDYTKTIEIPSGRQEEEITSFYFSWEGDSTLDVGSYSAIVSLLIAEN